MAQAIENRRSHTNFKPIPLTPQDVSTILFYSCGIIAPQTTAHVSLSRRAQPSGGGLYPIEVYPAILLDAGNIRTGYYHYNVRCHALETVRTQDVAELPTAFLDQWVAEAAMVLLFSFIEHRSKPKYGNFAYKLGLIEAGHIGQNVYLTATALGLQCRALGDMDYEKVHKLLGLDGVGEVIFYAVAIGGTPQTPRGISHP